MASITQEFRSAQAVLGNHCVCVEGHPEHLPGVLAQWRCIGRIPQCGGGAGADQVAGRGV